MSNESAYTTRVPTSSRQTLGTIDGNSHDTQAKLPQPYQSITETICLKAMHRVWHSLLEIQNAFKASMDSSEETEMVQRLAGFIEGVLTGLDPNFNLNEEKEK